MYTVALISARQNHVYKQTRLPPGYHDNTKAMCASHMYQGGSEVCDRQP
jgi:hypothetical protein